MNTLEEGKNYVMANGEETGPLVRTSEGRFRSGKVRALNHEGKSCISSPQVWNSDGSVYASNTAEVKQHTIQIDFPKRWEAHITYALANGYVDVDIYQFEEFEELGERIEGGRDFHTVEEITIRLNPDHLARMFKKG